jgi:hypothetical protein
MTALLEASPTYLTFMRAHAQMGERDVPAVKWGRHVTLHACADERQVTSTIALAYTAETGQV